MGWLWGANDQKESGKNSKGLDPELREYLKQETPAKLTNLPPAPKPGPGPQPPSEVPSKQKSQPTQTPEDPENKVPSQSLFKDGRYAHLWKTYHSPEELENIPKTHQEKVDGLIEGYKHRKAQIGITALENCALEQWQINDCFKNGPWSERLVMCRQQTQRLDRCYTMQTRFLKALGYMSTFDRPPEVEEEIQMHADTLYHRMLAQEKATEEAKSAGKPLPKFPPILTHAKRDLLIEEKFKISNFKPDVQRAYKKRLDGLEGEARALEEKSLQAELQANEELKQNLRVVWSDQEQEVKEKEQKGQAGVGDRIWKMLRFN